jgi:hypothetical protein
VQKFMNMRYYLLVFGEPFCLILFMVLLADGALLLIIRIIIVELYSKVACVQAHSTRLQRSSDFFLPYSYMCRSPVFLHLYCLSKPTPVAQ